MRREDWSRCRAPRDCVRMWSKSSPIQLRRTSSRLARSSRTRIHHFRSVLVMETSSTVPDTTHVRPSANAGADHLIDPGVFRQGMRQLVGGVTLITTHYAGRNVGLTATAVCSLSATPPRLIVCVNSKGATYKALCASRRMGVNVLAF